MTTRFPTLLLAVGLLLVVPPLHAQSCQSDRVRLQMLGTGGPELLNERASTGYLIWLDDKARSIDRQDETIELVRKSYQGPIIFADDLQSFHP